MSRECTRCHTSDWRPFALCQPILALACQQCGAVDWIGFLPEEWAEYVEPLSGKRTKGY